MGEEAVRSIILGISIAYANLAGADMVCHWPARSHTAEISGHTVDLSGPLTARATRHDPAKSLASCLSFSSECYATPFLGLITTDTGPLWVT
ncbi:hypothetical protein GE21DRAFT_1206123 [Neurospora crassa]|nr:hypothetical protein GE21DRAFT_1206123 [Neurospora crassa]